MSSISISSGLGARGCTLRPVNVRKYRARRATFCFVVVLSISPLLHLPAGSRRTVPVLRRSDRVLQERRCEILPPALPRPGEHQPAVAIPYEPDPRSAAVRADALCVGGNHRPGRPVLDHDRRCGEPLLPRDEPLAIPHGQTASSAGASGGTCSRIESSRFGFFSSSRNRRSASRLYGSALMPPAPESAARLRPCAQLR